MEESEKKIDYGKKIAGWKVPEFDKHKREQGWYILSSIVAILLIVYAFLSGNFLFAAIIVIGALIIILHDGQEPLMVNFVITDEGLIVGKRFYEYDVVKNFSLVYKPKDNVKNLYFEFKNVIRPRLSIPLKNLNPLPIRENLLKYLPEDLDRTDQPLSEALGKLFKL